MLTIVGGAIARTATAGPTATIRLPTTVPFTITQLRCSFLGSDLTDLNGPCWPKRKRLAGGEFPQPGEILAEKASEGIRTPDLSITNC